MKGRIPLEQDRRDLMNANPELYKYIVNLECAKELDNIGDSLSGRAGWGHDAANIVWSVSAVRKAAATRAIAKLRAEDREPVSAWSPSYHELFTDNRPE